jgi:hypothetical protein
MADDLKGNEEFWKGIAAGFLAGITIAAALRYTPFEKFLTRASTVEGKLDKKPANLEAGMSVATGLRASRGENPDAKISESAPGPAPDPAGPGFYSLSDRTSRATSSEGAWKKSRLARKGGSPVGRNKIELMEAPNPDAEQAEPIDLTRRKQPRSLDMGSAG